MERRKKPSVAWVYAVALTWVVLLFGARRIPGADRLGEVTPLWVALLDALIALGSTLVLHFEQRYSFSVVLPAFIVFYISSILLGVLFQEHVAVFALLAAAALLVRFLYTIFQRLRMHESAKVQPSGLR